MTDLRLSSTPYNIEEGYMSQAGLPPAILQELQSGAFASLCQHLQERSDEVSNMDLMTLAGFCRNCLAKVSVSSNIFEAPVGARC
jgi:hypothetical protein